MSNKNGEKSRLVIVGSNKVGDRCSSDPIRRRNERCHLSLCQLLPTHFFRTEKQKNVIMDRFIFNLSFKLKRVFNLVCNCNSMSFRSRKNVTKSILLKNYNKEKTLKYLNQKIFFFSFLNSF